jgi:hypothetical protein
MRGASAPHPYPRSIVDFPVEHLSASSITRFVRCPRQWQDYYVLGNKGTSNSHLVIGLAAHLALSRLLKGEEAANYWLETVEEQGDINWAPLTPEKAHGIAIKHVYDYYETVGKYLMVEETEAEISFEVPGVPIPVVGKVDVVCPDRGIDVKTTAYMNSARVQVNREWVLQGEIYQIAYPKPFEFHVVTRAKENPLVLPSGPSHPLYVPLKNPFITKNFVRQVYEEILFFYETYGADEPWRGNITHPWADKYCSAPNCCRREV